ncbi:hypothetical protein PRIPAC_92179, partial [Pristionchus pacificus]
SLPLLTPSFLPFLQSSSFSTMKVILVLSLLISISFCCDKFEKNVNLYCRFGQEENPCLLDQVKVEESKKDCCAKGCSFVNFKKEKTCCFTQECLDRCYPGKEYKMGQVY